MLSIRGEVRVRMVRCGVALVGAALLLVAAPRQARATFPGRNGSIVVAQQAGSKYSMQHIWLSLIAPRSGQLRHIDVCSVANAVSGGPYCRGSGKAQVSPGGTRIGL